MNNYLIKQINKAIKKNNGVIPKYVDTYNAAPVNNEICITITTSTIKWGGVGSIMIIEEKPLKIKNANSKGYLEANAGDGVDISSRMETHRGTVQKGKIQTLKASLDVGVCVKDERSERERERE